MRAVGVAFVLLVSGLAGCIGSSDDERVETSAVRSLPIPEDVAWNTTGPFSKPLTKGPFSVLPVELLEFPSFDGTRISTAVWRPEVPEGETVPVILEIGPYWGDFIDDIGDGFEKQFFLDGIVPHGYAYARVAIRGTASSGGCMEFFSLNEQEDMNDIVEFYGTQPWSNGNVGLWGGSYDGTTQWEAALWGNPHLKTIVPLSGLTSIYDHAFRNGTAVVFGPVFHGVYYADGFTTVRRTPEDKLANAVCPESWGGLVMGPYTTATGDYVGPGPLQDYWLDRDFRERVLENYRGSVFLIHGLQDWRVPPHMAYPFLNELSAQGVETKALLGQWWHALPDDSRRRDHIRWDHAEVLLRWFDRYLKEDATVDTGPAVDVEDQAGDWRTEERWPPADAVWTTYYLGDGELAPEPTGPGEQVLADPANAAGVAHDVGELAAGGTTTVASPLDYRASLGRVEDVLRFAGSARLHATFVPSSPEGARLYAELIDVGSYGRETVVAHALMDLRYHAGGHERHQLTPGEPVLALIEFYPADVVIAEGHELVLRVVNGNGYVPHRNFYSQIDNVIEHPTPLPVTIQWGDDTSVLQLPEIVRDVGDGTYPGQP